MLNNGKVRLNGKKFLLLSLLVFLFISFSSADFGFVDNTKPKLVGTSSTECSCNINVTSFGNASSGGTSNHLAKFSSANPNILIDSSITEDITDLGIPRFNIGSYSNKDMHLIENKSMIFDETVGNNYIKSESGILKLVSTGGGTIQTITDILDFKTYTSAIQLPLIDGNIEVSGFSTFDNNITAPNICYSNGSSCAVSSVNLTNYAMTNITNNFNKPQNVSRTIIINSGSFTGAGTLTYNGGTDYTGTNTKFTSELQVGDLIYIGDDSAYYYVLSIGSDTSVQLSSGDLADGSSYTVYPQSFVIKDSSGKYLGTFHTAVKEGTTVRNNAFEAENLISGNFTRGTGTYTSCGLFNAGSPQCNQYVSGTKILNFGSSSTGGFFTVFAARGMACGTDYCYLGTSASPEIIVNTTTHTTNITGNLLITGNLSVRRPYGMFSSTQTQTIAVANTAYPVTFNWTEDNYLIYKSSDNANFTFAQTGDYLIELSAVFTASVANKHVQIWVQKNGVNIPRSNTKVELATSGIESVVAVPFIIDMNTTDKMRIMWASDDTGTQMLFTTNTSYSPETPSIIMTINKISEITP